MNNYRHNDVRPGTRRWAWGLVVLFVMCATTVWADRVRNDLYYVLSNHGDYISFDLLMTDLGGRNTYCKSGTVWAVNTQTSKEIKLFDVYTNDMKDDDRSDWDIYAQMFCKGAKAYLTNCVGNPEKEITAEKTKYTVDKGYKNDYVHAKINFLIPASLEGGTWRFIYRYNHNHEGNLTRNIGTTTINVSSHYSETKMSDYKLERTGPRTIKFTTPAMASDVEDKYRSVRWHECSYSLEFSYELQNGSTVRQTEKFSCEVGQKKTYEITVPAKVGNFKNAYIDVYGQDRLMCSDGNHYWDNRYNYILDPFASVPYPTNLQGEYKQYDSQMLLTWSVNLAGGPGYSVMKDAVPYIYRIETDKQGQPIDGESWTKRGSISDAGKSSYTFTDRGVSAGTWYQYMVVMVPNSWIKNQSYTTSDLNSITDEMLAQLGYQTLSPVATSLYTRINNLQQDLTVTDRVRLTWTYDRVPVKAQKVDFQVWKRAPGTSEWSEAGKVNADANPAAGTVASYTDGDLPGGHVPFEYKVSLSINGGNNVFESGVVTAAIIDGTTGKNLLASKGTHEGTVRLTWGSNQVGNSNATYVLSRRYAGTDDEFMKIYSTTGTSTNYVYEDNTVLPGYYYEYRLDTYSSESTAAADGGFQNSLTDVGFCQARGVITGRVTFGTGTAVEDVRLSLRPTSENNDNTVKGYSQYVGGASEGIVWNADSAATAQLFDNSKDYTVQLFVRPDSALSEGAVVGHIPGLGHIVLGKEKDGCYPLQCVRTTVTTIRQAFTEAYAFRGICYSSNISEDTYNATEQCTVYTYKHFMEIGDQWQAEGYQANGILVDIDGEPGGKFCLFRRKVSLDEPISHDIVERSVDTYDLGIDIAGASYSLLTVSCRQGQWSFSVNDATSTSMTHLHNETATKELDLPDDYVVYNNALVYLGGTLVDTFHGDRWKNYVADATTPQVSTEVAPGPFAVGGAHGIAEGQAFRGHLTEVRVWDHVLSDKERASYADRMLNGHEDGLKLYWPMDEGLDHYVFDASYANDTPNSRHAVVGSNITASVIIPADDQLSRYALTDGNGDYIIRGIPFIGSGSTYAVVPSKSIHTFSPQSRNGFIGNGNLTLNAYDFTDDSSFPVKGKVTYLDTNIPADSIQFMVDGNIAYKDNKAVTTDSNGEYEISVPIGEHLIEAYRNGHRLTSFPLDGSTYDFHRAETVNFIDSTLVNVTGRINGGFSDQDAPVGFGLSTNRIGQATIKLSLGKEAQCSFNYRLDEHGDGTFGTEPIAVESASELVGSKAWRGGGEHDDTYYVYITTDAQTGEYSALLPPLKYKVESITFAGGTDYDSEPVFSQNLPMIDATNTIAETLPKDSLVVEGQTLYYTYSGKMNRQLRTAPTITVRQKGMDEGVFGEMKVAVKNEVNGVDSVDVVTLTDSGCNYRFGHPIIMQNERYTLDINVSEVYRNLDTGREVREYPEDAEIIIMNDASLLVSVVGEKAVIDGEEVEAGAEYEVPRIQITPDSVGHATYQFVGGFPYLGEGYLRSLNISAQVDGRTYPWQNGESTAGDLPVYVLGVLASGTNFMTEGPDKPDYIIRRPPGSTSVATYETKTIHTNSTTEVDADSKFGGGGAWVSAAPTFKLQKGTPILGMLIYLASKWHPVVDTYLGRDNSWEDSDVEATSDTYTLTDLVSTPREQVYSVDDGKFRADGGDTFIGRSTNHLFSKGLVLNVFKQADGTYALEQREGLAFSEIYGTTFAYTQAYVIDVLIPNWKAAIESKLTHVDGNHWDPSVAKKVEGQVMYYTMYNKGDAEYGRHNADPRWGTLFAERNGWPSYMMVDGTGEMHDDEIELAINQIQRWESVLAMNEQDKLEAFDDSDRLIDNYSFANGTSVSMTTTNSNTQSTTHSHDTYHNVIIENKDGALLNNAGAYVKVKANFGHHDKTVTDESASSANTVSWTLSDADPRTALSVDVYESPAGWGPIFRTRGGQSANPYQDATYTRYYEVGAKLDEATMRVEVPQLKVANPQLTGVPAGGEAKFTLEMSNLSETGHASTFLLEVIDKSNPNGAILSMDGAAISSGRPGRSVLIQGGETVTKTLIVRQSDRSINNYDNIRLVLRSEKDRTAQSEEVALSVQFVPASAHIDIAVANTVLNQADKEQYGGFRVQLSNLDRQDNGLQGVRLQYRRKGMDAWSLAHQWLADAAQVGQGDEQLPEAGEQLAYQVVFPADGTYELRAQTFGKYGNDDVTYETDIIEVTQDTRGPQILGMVSPTEGSLTYLNRNDMHLRFNETLNGNAMSKTDNFRIEGGMNNVVVDAARPYPDVALQLNGQEAQTDANFLLSNSDVAMGFWLYRQGDGTLLSIGNEGNRFALGTYDGGQLSIEPGAGNDVVKTGVVLPADTWTYVAMNYRQKRADEITGHLTMLYVNAGDNNPVYVVRECEMDDVFGQGRLSLGGDGMVGRISSLTLWNSDISAQQLFESRNELKANYTLGLIGYWRMDEGHGQTMTDRVRSRDLTMASDSWYINNENRAAHLDGSEALKIDVSTLNFRSTDNFAMELWFRAEASEQNSNAQLLSAQSGLSIGFADGKLTLADRRHYIDGGGQEQVSVVKQTELSDRNYCDGTWHHVALNVRRGISAVAYIDGQAVKTLPESDVEGMIAHYLLVGGEETLLDADGASNGGQTRLFTGDIDEVRLWSAALDGQLIADRMYERLDDTYAGLVGYFPMEDINRNVTGTVTTTFSTQNKGMADSRLTLVGTPAQSLTAPALKPGSSRMRLADNQFDYVVSDDEIYFRFGDDVLSLMDGNDFTVTVANIKDEHGNSSEPVSWTFHADFAALNWSPRVADISKKWNETQETTAYILDRSETLQSYEISSLPSWLTLKGDAVGTTTQYLTDIYFEIPSSVPVGRYADDIYLTDRLGIQRILHVNLTVEGDVPDWAVDASAYESNMALRGQVMVGDKISDYTGSKIAAFDSNGNCRGVASPAYVKTRDAYYVDMTIYGGSATSLSSAERELTFMLYDASTGTTYPVVSVTVPGRQPATTLTYSPDAVIGSYDAPVLFSASDFIMQHMQLDKGWAWTSIYVQPASTAIADVLPQNSTELKKLHTVKSHTGFATVAADGSKVTGMLQTIEPGQMYKVRTKAATSFDVLGTLINVRNTEATMAPQYNWIGTLSNVVMSPAQAFADLQPENGDMVKTRTAFSTYRDGVWEGNLQSIVPGQGYIYLSKAAEAKTFRYPQVAASSDAQSTSFSLMATEGEMGAATYYTPMDEHLFPDNMNMIAVVKKDGMQIETAEVAAFVNGECRGAIECMDGYYFLTILGSSADDQDAMVEIRVRIDGEEYTVASQPFVSDALFGSLDEPYVLDVDATAIRTVNIDGAADDDEWYTLQGQKLSRRPMQQGVYIHHGQKVTVRR